MPVFVSWRHEDKDEHSPSLSVDAVKEKGILVGNGIRGKDEHRPSLSVGGVKEY